MSGRKIIVLISNESDPVRFVNFVVELFRSLHVTVVVVFDTNAAFSLERRLAIAATLHESFTHRPQIDLVVRNTFPIKREELERESNYTDLVVVQANHSSTYFSERSVPIIVVPQCTERVDEVIITFDGRKSGFETIRQFCQIMGDLCRKSKVTLLEINHDSDRFLPEEEKLSVEYLKGHCNNLGIYKVSEESPQQVMQRISSGHNAIVVSGTLENHFESNGESVWLTSRLMSENSLPGFFGSLRPH